MQEISAPDKSEALMRMVTVYEKPKDFPGVPFVARMWRLEFGSEPIADEVIAQGSLLKCRPAARRAGFGHRMARIEEDDPAVLEVWI